MPLPLGHAAIGWAVYRTVQPAPARDEQGVRPLCLAQAALVAILANLPDLDMVYGLVFYGNGSAVHRGPTHSLVFALIAGLMASNLWRLWHRIPRFGFVLCFWIVFSHVVADWLLTSSPVSLLWPLELHFVSGYKGWGQVVQMVLFQSIKDTGIVAFCLIYLVGLRYLRSLRDIKLFSQ